MRYFVISNRDKTEHRIRYDVTFRTRTYAGISNYVCTYVEADGWREGGKPCRKRNIVRILPPGPHRLQT
jgi:hypothetical protein